MRLARGFRPDGVAAGILIGVAVVLAAAGAVRAEEKPARGAPAVSGPSRTTPAVTPPRHCICTTEYNPVCGRTPGGVEFTFSNPCRARCVGATVIRRGPC